MLSERGSAELEAFVCEVLAAVAKLGKATIAANSSVADFELSCRSFNIAGGFRF